MKVRGDTVRVCVHTGKRSYRTQLKAARALDLLLARQANGERHRHEAAAYRCPYAPHWHLTSWEQTETALASGKAVA